MTLQLMKKFPFVYKKMVLTEFYLRTSHDDGRVGRNMTKDLLTFKVYVSIVEKRLIKWH
jgi:hypothetical protein